MAGLVSHPPRQTPKPPDNCVGCRRHSCTPEVRNVAIVMTTPRPKHSAGGEGRPGSRTNLMKNAEGPFSASRISDRAQFVRKISSSAISRRNRVPPEYITTPPIDSS